MKTRKIGDCIINIDKWNEASEKCKKNIEIALKKYHSKSDEEKRIERNQKALERYYRLHPKKEKKIETVPQISKKELKSIQSINNAKLYIKKIHSKAI